VRFIRFIMRSTHGHTEFMDVLEVTVRGTTAGDRTPSSRLLLAERSVQEREDARPLLLRVPGETATLRPTSPFLRNRR
jgi:hypothetical protein